LSQKLQFSATAATFQLNNRKVYRGVNNPGKHSEITVTPMSNFKITGLSQALLKKVGKRL